MVHRLVEPPLVVQEGCQVVVRVHVVRVDRQSFPASVNRLIEPSESAQRKSQRVVDPGSPGVFSQHLLQEGFGFLRSSRSHQSVPNRR